MIETVALDPVAYAVFSHRLWAIGEEGRLTLQRVTASPIVAQGGECMQSFYDPDGRMVLACSGHLRFAAATSDAIRKIVEWFAASPGFRDGDQIFFNDPYVAGSHTQDEMVIKPIYFGGELIAWTASSSHTADVGGVLSGEATEIYHEGIRILGLKVVEAGEYREDVCKTLAEQCRDPYYVELDLRSRIAGNNVAGSRFLELVGQFGVDFVRRACAKLIADGESLAREKLRRIPDGRWTSQAYGISRRGVPYVVVCEATKEDDRLGIDFTGTSPQVGDDVNSTLPSTYAHVAVALTNGIFWDVPWNDGKMAPVHVTVPEGTILNCRFPAPCLGAPRVGQVLVAAVTDCTARMLYAAGLHQDVNAIWNGLLYEGGPGFSSSGHNADGIRVAGGLFDIHGGGAGAAPYRDGVDTAGHPNIPSGGINDIERIELHYPFLYFTRNHVTDGAGYGKYRGGAGTQRIYMIYGSQDLHLDFRPYEGVPQSGHGLLGGYPVGGGGLRALFEVDAEAVRARLARTEYPATPGELLAGGWGTIAQPQRSRPRVLLPEYTLVADFVQSGGGFGDPLLRDPEAVVRDVQARIYSAGVARSVFGVVLGEDGQALLEETRSLRAALVRERLGAARPVSGEPFSGRKLAAATALIRPGEGFEIVEYAGDRYWRCYECHAELGPADATYKLRAAVRVTDLNDFAVLPCPSPIGFDGALREYLCPGCGRLLQVDLYCPGTGTSELIADAVLRLG
jgi:N-methylhydantoinase B